MTTGPASDSPAGGTVYERFRAFVDDSGGPDACHPWTGSTRGNGYGQIKADGRMQYAPRWLLGFLRGRPLGGDESALHDCDNPPCVNPAHLYVGTKADNAQDALDRGRFRNVIAAANALKTHCRNGHPYDEANTYRMPNGKRQCRICKREASRAFYARRAA